MAQALFENAVLIALNLSTFGNHKQLGKDQFSVDADKHRIGAHKKLLQCAVLQQVSKLDSQTRNWLTSRTVSTLFKAGMFLLPIACVEETEAYLQTYRAQRAALLSQFHGPADPELFAAPDEPFANLYEQLVAMSAHALRGVHNPLDYPPTAEAMISKFRVAWTYLEVQTPNKLNKIAPELFKRQADALEAKFKKVADDVESVLWSRTAAMVNDLLESLTGGTDGQAKKFHNDKVDKMRDFCATLPKLNLTGVGQLDEMAAKMDALLDGVDAAMLKDSASCRKYVADGLSAISKTAQSFLLARPSRMIELPDDDDTEEA